VEAGIIKGNLHIGYFDKVTKPVVQCVKNQKPGSGDQFTAYRLKEKLKKSAPEIRTVYPFPRGGKKHLFNQVTDMVIRSGFRCMPVFVKLVGKFQVHGIQIPVTLVWVIMMESGVELGMQSDWLSTSSRGIPFDFTRVAPVIHCAEVQGEGEPEILKGHPLTTNG
jgi:hypothetical protein